MILNFYSILSFNLTKSLLVYIYLNDLALQIVEVEIYGETTTGKVMLLSKDMTSNHACTSTFRKRSMACSDAFERELTKKQDRYFFPSFKKKY